MKKSLAMVDQPTLIAYYCPRCEKIVKGMSRGGNDRYSFACPTCKESVMFGTAKSLIRYIRIKEHTENGQILLSMQQEKMKMLEKV